MWSQLPLCGLLVLLLVNRVSSVIIEASEVNGIAFGKVEDYWTGNKFSIEFMQEDKLIPGNILLYADEEGLISISPEKVISVVAEKKELQYRGVKTVSSFAQHNSTTLILVDGDSNCLLWLNRIGAFSEDPDFSIAGLAGNCRSNNNFESVDGLLDQARFNQPGYIVMGRNNTEYFISESVNKNGAIKHLNLQRGLVSTFLGGAIGQPNWRNPHAMVFVPKKQILYIATRSNIYSVNFGSGGINALASGVRNIADGDLRTSKFVNSQSLAFLSDDIILAVPGIVPLMRLIDLQNKHVFSFKLPTDNWVGCVLAVPSQKRIYLGGSNGISMMQYQNISTEILPEEYMESAATSLVVTASSTLAILVLYVMI